MVYVAAIYVTGVVISFLVGCFLCERVDGRVCTGEPDFEQSVAFALLWPLVLMVCAIAYVVFKSKRSPT